VSTWRKISIVVVLAAGSMAAIASGEAEDTEGGGGDGGGATAEEGQPAAESDVSGEPDQVDDVTLGECTTDPTLNLLTGTVEVTNDSSDTSDYNIEVVFQSADGATQFGTGTAFVSSLASGQTTTAEVATLDEAPAEPFECKLTSVFRTASL